MVARRFLFFFVSFLLRLLLFYHHFAYMLACLPACLCLFSSSQLDSSLFLFLAPQPPRKCLIPIFFSLVLICCCLFTRSQRGALASPMTMVIHGWNELECYFATAAGRLGAMDQKNRVLFCGCGVLGKRDLLLGSRLWCVCYGRSGGAKEGERACLE
ncbi:hypothetical protein BT67DRAFT_137544 [Trichocladium antarcticum]|uniref:Uncharacterized protein n=1 Tax=Trichocladium antarcticum TaxID=1450529 RepID=A0AAN6UFM8_9PEZI|nr:hypothetical protein BT67DRAFT_137544 [Trichocladium antarcticum]